MNLIKEVNKEDSDSDDSQKSWKKNTTKAERLYVLGAAQAMESDYDSDFSVDNTTARKYLRKLRKQSKHRKGANTK